MTPVTPPRPPVSLVILPLALAVAACPAAGVAVAAPPAAVEAAPQEGLVVPPLPEGTPEELLAFVAGLMPPKGQPKSREEALNYVRGVVAVSAEAAEKVLAAVREDDPLHAKAAMLKLESLMRLSNFGDEKAGAELETYAATLVASPQPELSMEARRLLIVAEAQKMFAAGSFDAAPGIVAKAVELMKAAPVDQKTAMLVTQLSGALEQIPGGERLAADALKTFGPLLAASPDQRIKDLAASLAGKLRLLDLPGKPMEITGTLLDGKAFDQKSLAGKVVLVDFWATWCGPCVAEIPNVLEQYAKYHALGFEVLGISLDDEKDKVDAFVAEHEIPWPIIFAGKGWQDPVAQFYGISGIPQLILIGRDGNVITLNARGERLAEQLAELFKDGG